MTLLIPSGDNVNMLQMTLLMSKLTLLLMRLRRSFMPQNIEYHLTVKSTKSAQQQSTNDIRLTGSVVVLLGTKSMNERQISFIYII